MPYQHVTFGEAKDILATRLGDPSEIFHTDTENGYAIIEALRMWNAITANHRTRELISLTAGTAFYDLSAVASRTRSVRDRNLVSEIEYHLIEPQGLTTWVGTDQFTLAQITNSLQQRRDQFLAETACTLTARTYTIDPNGYVTLEDDVIGVRRVVFVSLDGKYFPLRPTSELIGARRVPETTTKPYAYSVTASPQLQLRIMPPPQNAGEIRALVVTAGAAINTAGAGTLIGVPNDYAWGVKYGALADLYMSVDGQNTTRAAYCEGMFQTAVRLAKAMPVVLTAQIDGANVGICTLGQADMLNGGWEGKDTGTPRDVSIAGPELLAVTPVPDTNPHYLLVDIVRNAPVPTNDDDYVDISRENLDAILGISQAISLLKCSDSIQEASQTLIQNFLNQALQYSLRRSAATTALAPMLKHTQMALNANPWEHTPGVADENPEEIRSERNARRRPFRKA